MNSLLNDNVEPEVRYFKVNNLKLFNTIWNKNKLQILLIDIQ